MSIPKPEMGEKSTRKKSKVDIMDANLVNWITEELKNRGWSLRELGRRANLSHATISHILSGQTNPGLDFCVGIARAFNVPAETVLRLADLLPHRAEDTELRREAMYLFDQLDEETQQTFITILRGYVRETAPPYNTKPSIS